MNWMHQALVAAGAIAAVSTAVAQFAPATWQAPLHGIAAGGVALTVYFGLASPQAIGTGAKS